MDINRANMTVFFQDLKTEFTKGMNAVAENLIKNKIAMSMPSTGASTVHGWINQIPGVREWIGDRNVNNIESNKLTVVNRKFESTIEMPREDIEDDQHGLYRPLANTLGQRAVGFIDELLIEALLRGNADILSDAANLLKWADDLGYFSTARVYGANTIDNSGTDAFDAAGTKLEATITAMSAYLGHANKPLMINPVWYIVHGPALRSRVHKAVQADQTALLAGDASTYIGTVSNPNYKLVVPVQTPYLIDGYKDSKGETYDDAGTYWFLMADVAGIRPLVHQERKAPEFQSSRMSDDSDFVFETDKYQMGTRSRGAAFVSLPHLVYGQFATT